MGPSTRPKNGERWHNCRALNDPGPFVLRGPFRPEGRSIPNTSAPPLEAAPDIRGRG
eukprot:NODE_31301_length_192_cov_0.615385_g30131_i0.p3 GENE.NODE_31301_length_192_cov_0.615385_g30131_i0~~NODE_31301_length_192_cov_0.615385_g30131_i0.p3  ORF type:complete len:57 (+),score=0.06 NODE_31301_length_192_cov_0.615385_g30131_i0:3-173(+)